MTVLFVANPGSVHVRRWLVLVGRTGTAVTGVTADTGPLPPGWRRLVGRGGSLRYLLSGLLLRFCRSKALLHAHNASGNGLAAYLSGGRYALTVYGTDVYGAGGRGPLYRWLLGRILRRACRVSCTTRAMAEHIAEQYAVPSQKIDMFSLGLPLDLFAPSADLRRSARRRFDLEGAYVLFANRRLRSQYRTELIIEAFARFHAQRPDSRLVLLEGDADPDHVVALEALIDNLDLDHVVRLIRGSCAPEGVHELLCAADVVISIPTSDQMSASVLEALACDCPLLLSDIPAYAELFALGLAHRADTASAVTLLDSILAMSASGSMLSQARAWLQRWHSDEAAAQNIRLFYEKARLS
jgi:glycosyltransferase involved in cell wall biosynthesis